MLEVNKTLILAQRLRRPRRLGVLSILLCAVLASAATAEEDHAYLQEELRATWSMQPLQEVLNELARRVEVPLNISDGVSGIVDQPVVLITEQRVTVERILQLLERSHNLRFSPESLRLRVETLAEVEQRRRRVVTLQLGDLQALTSAPSFSSPALGFTHAQHRSGGGAGFDLMGGGGGLGSDSGINMGEALALLERFDSFVGADNRLYMELTPEEESFVRSAVERQFDIFGHQQRWRVDVGVIAGGVDVELGVLDADQAAALRQQLAAPRSFMLSAIVGQRVQAHSRGTRELDDDIKVVNSVALSDTSRLEHGVSVSLMALRGMTANHLSLKLQWVEPADRDPLDIAIPALQQGPALDVSGGKNNFNANLKQGRLFPAQTLRLDRPGLWSWYPQVEVLLPHGRAIALMAPHREGNALVIIEEVTP